MKAVNLIPKDAGRGRGGPSADQIPAYTVLALLAAAVVLVTVYVLTSNTISERQAKVVTLQAQATQANAEAASLSKYVKFEQVAQARAQTVRQIAATRFDWHGALADLSKVVPANTSLQSLVGTVAPGAGTGGAAGGGGTGALRSDVSAPAFELTGCTKTQDDVARLMSRLRLINSVTRVTLADTAKPSGSASAATSGAGAGAGSSATSVGCGGNAPTFDLVVFFSPLPGAGAQGATSPLPVVTGGSNTGASSPSAATTTPGVTR